MKPQKVIVLMAIVDAIIIGWLVWPVEAVNVSPTITSTTTPEIVKSELKRRQEVWISALEWCESKAKNTALNPEDLDGTPSYSNFQWKPSTLLQFGKKYNLIPATTTLKQIPELLKDYELQREVVRRMIDDPKVNLHNQFPDCINRKIGPPPTK